MTLIWAGLALGIAGTAHCVAMCGPLVVAVRRGVFRSPPDQARQSAGDLLCATLYQAGRLATYTALGALAGAFGQVLFGLGLGRGVAVVAGIALIASAIVPVASILAPNGARAGRRIGAGVAALTRWHGRRPRLVAAGLGALHGLLPCGLVYAALTAAIAMGDALRASAFMAAFGAGTLPAIGGAWVLLGAMRPIRHQFVRAVAPVAVVLVGLLLLQRGLASAPHVAHGAAPSTAISHLHTAPGR